VCGQTGAQAVELPSQQFTSCGSQDDTACDAPNKRNQECALVTSSSLCPLPDLGACGASAEDGQFRLIFTPDVQVWPGYKLNGSNPGQYYYNAIVDCMAPGGCDATINIPYPFVTQGAMPVHVYPDPDFSRGCFAPSGSGVASALAISMGSWISPPATGPVSCDQVTAPNQLPDFPGNIDKFCTFTVHVPGTGLSYVNVHLDYGLKGPGVNANPFDGIVDRYDGVLSGGATDAFVDVNNTLTTPSVVAIDDCARYEFWHGAPSGDRSATVQSVNAFKKISGVYSQSFRSSSGRVGIPGVTATLKKKGTNPILASGLADEDGYVLLNYKHTGKAAAFTVTLVIPGVGTRSQDVTLKANGWAEVSYDADTGTWFVDVK